ncbi:hypothetical protein [Qipengyuania sediminis]|uniref:hypothetical protein n=1 Tax=Qipengyuania sediminis TaxID=1532023 RepID=UPI0010597569|nr:hypothetical protein [Qipengyuania sediminis]
MTLRQALLIAAPLTLALAGCARSDDASSEAEADTVEIPANEALAPVDAAPVADPNANAALPAPTAAATPTETEQERIQAAGDSAADTAAAAADAMEETATEANQTEGQ